MTNQSDIAKAAAALGRMGGLKGGKAKSERKAASSKANGAKGGRPGMYAVESLARGYRDFGPTTYHGDGLSRSAAVSLARELVAGGWHGVHVTWARASDGQHGYLNPGGDHSITGIAWDRA